MSDASFNGTQIDLGDGAQIGQLCFDMAVRLVITSTGGTSQAVINSDFDVRVDHLPLRTSHPARLSPEDLVSLKLLVWRSVSRVCISDLGELAMIGDGFEVRVHSSPDYEPWEFVHAGGLIALGLPGGDVSFNREP